MQNPHADEFYLDQLQQYIDDHSMEESDLLKALDRKPIKRYSNPECSVGHTKADYWHY